VISGKFDYSLSKVCFKPEFNFKIVIKDTPSFVKGEKLLENFTDDVESNSGFRYFSGLRN